jgi:hypothetical protein
VEALLQKVNRNLHPYTPNLRPRTFIKGKPKSPTLHPKPPTLNLYNLALREVHEHICEGEECEPLTLGPELYDHAKVKSANEALGIAEGWKKKTGVDADREGGGGVAAGRGRGEEGGDAQDGRAAWSERGEGQDVEGERGCMRVNGVEEGEGAGGGGGEGGGEGEGHVQAWQWPCDSQEWILDEVTSSACDATPSGQISAGKAGRRYSTDN